ncbi:MAG: sigma-70 family RNA polymerase sigma factor, partial [Phycisphaeraceae bacterium]|nr:sigma-70 family RNA polymerase sigma factor [Phycisphaeraceae bacterium]
ILRSLRKGDKDALCAVYETYKDCLRTIAGSMLHDGSAAEDVLHDVFVSFSQQARQIRIKSSLKHYLIASVVNRVRDEYRRKHVKTTDLEHADAISSESDGPDRRVMAGETASLLREALVLIPFEQREVIVLHLRGGLTFKEIARLQTTTLSTAHGRYRYGLKKLHTLLNGELSYES